jgi:rhodanese-related sulfurtransferase
VLTGDTLFIGDVGRPDLSKSHTPQELAGLLYDSLHGKLLRLNEAVLVYPAHGAGSLCGRNMRAERSSTIGTERLTNYALQIPSREEFVTQLTSQLPARPDYFLRDAEINREGAAALSDLPGLQAVSPAELDRRMKMGAIALDVRAPDEFASRHVPGSVNVALSGQFASWAGIVLGLSSQIVLVADSADQIEEARMRLARVGIEDAHTYLDGGVSHWADAKYPVSTVPGISVHDLNQALQRGDTRVLDVRREAEWQSGHLAEASWWPLDNFRSELPPVDSKRPLAVHCKSGYRSMIACSLLEKAGYRNIVNVVGGYDAWQQANLPVQTATEVGA